MDNFEKQSGEQLQFSIDFSDSLDDGEYIASYTVKAVNESIDYTSTVVDSSDNTTTTVSVRVKGGIDGKNYKITVVITTTESNIYEKDILMRIVDI